MTEAICYKNHPFHLVIFMSLISNILSDIHFYLSNFTFVCFHCLYITCDMDRKIIITTGYTTVRLCLVTCTFKYILEHLILDLLHVYNDNILFLVVINLAVQCNSKYEDKRCPFSYLDYRIQT